MEKKSLKSYLKRAEYLLVFIQKFNHDSSLLKYKGVHIHSMNFRNLLNFNKITTTNPLKPPLERKKQIDRLKKLLFSNDTAQIFLMEGTNNKNFKAFKAAKMTSAVSNKQNLRLLHIGMIYYANNHKMKSIKGWKVPCLIHVSRQLQYILRSPMIMDNTDSDVFYKKYKVIHTLKKELKNKETGFRKSDLALEKEYSHRRNYRTSSPLHT